MFNPLNLISKIIKSRNQKELDRIKKIVDNSNHFEKDIEKLDYSIYPNPAKDQITIRANTSKYLRVFLPYLFISFGIALYIIYLRK